MGTKTETSYMKWWNLVLSEMVCRQLVRAYTPQEDLKKLILMMCANTQTLEGDDHVEFQENVFFLFPDRQAFSWSTSFFLIHKLFPNPQTLRRKDLSYSMFFSNTCLLIKILSVQFLFFPKTICSPSSWIPIIDLSLVLIILCTFCLCGSTMIFLGIMYILFYFLY